MTEKTAYIDAHRAEFGVEPICRAFEDTSSQIAPSTDYAAKKRPPSERELRDRDLCEKTSRICEDDYGVYGVRRIRIALKVPITGVVPAAPSASAGSTTRPTPSVQKGQRDSVLV
ncbi:hypothetical protein [Brevibacterium casei]|uniref:HTH-like domain-containing protein n=1 Tax=Brevibacterium casei TaxID=33889 RepID=A0A449D9C5_9MICO|nr:hypothetical protein [Brevibacterium casei]MCT1549995.1 hypothetical protein [Brevibacterium casei]MCT1562074.1 hypothetical protein [Brevibacterium casei]MCT2208055.1 hypothetical protein [Brevibacterium casei]QPS33520.1 hypothetical protein I6G59_16580 [Brevibacterium casei]VEW14163.1 Uncharacterised protein [Brevibacterium casei]